jgi:hypothetical protein
VEKCATTSHQDGGVTSSSLQTVVICSGCRLHVSAAPRPVLQQLQQSLGTHWDWSSTDHFDPQNNITRRAPGCPSKATVSLPRHHSVVHSTAQQQLATCTRHKTMRQHIMHQPGAHHPADCLSIKRLWHALAGTCPYHKPPAEHRHQSAVYKARLHNNCMPVLSNCWPQACSAPPRPQPPATGATKATTTAVPSAPTT